jgi:hypothetical protein
MILQGFGLNAYACLGTRLDQSGIERELCEWPIEEYEEKQTDRQTDRQIDR